MKTYVTEEYLAEIKKQFGDDPRVLADYLKGFTPPKAIDLKAIFDAAKEFNPADAPDQNVPRNMCRPPAQKM